MSFIPNRPKAEGMSSLEMFRQSPMYRALLKKGVRSKSLLVQSYHQQRANLVEQAKKWAEQNGDFSFAVIAKLIDQGLERALIEVEYQGSGCLVYFSDRIGRYKKELKNVLTEIAEIEEMAGPDETGNGLTIFQAVPKPEVNFQEFLDKLLGKQEKNEAFDPAFRVRR